MPEMNLKDEWRKHYDNMVRSRNEAIDAEEAFKDFIGGVISRDDPHRSAYDKLGKANIVPILFMDIVGYSKLKTDDEQKRAIELLNRLVRKALPKASCTLDDVVCLPTGDGMCLCFTKITDGPLIVAAKVQQELSKKENALGTRKKIKVRMAVHCGNVLRVKDLKGNYNLAGAAINISQRAMSCGDEAHILCTKDLFYQLKKWSKDYETAIKRIKKPFIVKHGKPLYLYNYYRLEEGFGNDNEPLRSGDNFVERPVKKTR